MYALIDGNNFYVSCERVFQPHLNGQPVVVLDVGGAVNRLAMGLPRTETVTQPAMEERAARIGRERRFPFNLAAVVHTGWLEREDKIRLRRRLAALTAELKR